MGVSKRDVQNWLSFMPMVLMVFGLLYINFHKTLKVITVHKEAEASTVFLTGTVAPLALYRILSPVDGVVSEVKIPYGQWVTKGDLLYVLDSSKLAEDFRQGMENLIKAINTYQKLSFQQAGNAELFKMGLISKVAYMDSEELLQSSKLDLSEAKAILLTLLETSGSPVPDLEKIPDSKIQEVLKPTRTVMIYAPEEGYLLFPSKAFGNNDDVKVARGLQVKQGQTLAYTGNMTGIYLEVVVDETELNNFYLGQKATITGAAFPTITLTGVIKNISRQANSSSADAVPTYSISVIVPELTQEERNIIYIGMAAEVAFTTENPPAITIPLEAIIEKKGHYLVKIMDKKGQVEEKRVVPGTTNESSIQILQGLSSGDQIVLPD